MASNGSSICEWAADGTCTAESAAWTKLDDPQDPNEPRPWAVSDVDDPVLMMPNGSEFQFNSGLGCADCMTTNVGAAAPLRRLFGLKQAAAQRNQLYTLDAIAYESLLVGLFSILQCKATTPACPGPHNDHEFNSVFLGFSRDGFHWFRPPPPRKAFAPMSLEGCDQAGHPAPKGGLPYAWRNCSVWNQADVQSVAGSFIVVGDELYSYVSGRSENMQLGQTGLLTLRRDGFASLQPASVGVGAFVLTRPVYWTLKRRHLFVNFRGEGLRVAIIDAATNRSIAPFSAEACAPLSVDSTRVAVRWANASARDLGALTGRPVRLHFEWASGSFFSFWLSASECGESRGFLDAGGVGIDDSGVDTTGACTDVAAAKTAKVDDEATHAWSWPEAEKQAPPVDRFARRGVDRIASCTAWP